MKRQQLMALGALGALSLIIPACSSGEEEIDPPTIVPPLDFDAVRSQTGAVRPQGTAGSSGSAGAGAVNSAAGGSGGGASVPSGTGGTTMVVGAAGAGMMPAVGGAAMTSVLTPDATLWVARTTNAVGIQGSFLSISDAGDGGATTISAAELNAQGAICVRGTAGQVQNGANGMPDYGTYWGGGLQLNLSDPGGGAGATPQPWDRAGGRVTSFTFQLSGPTIPADLRFGVGVNPVPAGVQAFCNTGLVAGLNSRPLASVEADCWDAAVTQNLTTEQMVNVQWMVPTNAAAAVPFDFCVSQITAVVQ